MPHPRDGVYLARTARVDEARGGPELEHGPALLRFRVGNQAQRVGQRLAWKIGESLECARGSAPARDWRPWTLKIIIRE